MAKIKINKDKCKGCYLCIVNCPNGLIKVAKDMNVKGVKPATYTSGKCTGCRMCAVICPDGAITVFR